MDKLNVASIVDACEIKFNVPLRDWSEPELLKFYAKYGEQLDISEQQQIKTIAIVKKEIAKRHGKVTIQRSYRTQMKPVTLVDEQGNSIRFNGFKDAAKFLNCKRAYISVIKRQPQNKRLYKGYTLHFDDEEAIDHEQK